MGRPVFLRQPRGTETSHRQLRCLRMPAPVARRHVGETPSSVLQDRRRLLRLRPGQRGGAEHQAARRLQRQRAQCRKIIDRIGQKNFRIWYDPGNVFYYSDGKLDPADDAAAVDGVVIGMSVKDFRPPKNVEPHARCRQSGFCEGPVPVEAGRIHGRAAGRRMPRAGRRFPPESRGRESPRVPGKAYRPEAHLM